MEDTVYDVIIIGGGPAGATAAIYTARAGLNTLVIDKGLTSGALGLTSRIANYPGITDEISGAELLERMRSQARGFGTQFINDKVIGVDFSTDTKSVFGNAGVYNGRAVIIATGSMGRGTRIKGESELLGRGVSYCATCDAAFFKEQEVLVAGSSDEAVEEALYLTRFASRVHVLCPGTYFKAPQHLIDELKASPKVTLYMETALREIHGNGKVDAALFEKKGGQKTTLPVSAAFIYLQGGRPITDFLQGQMEISESGCLLTDRECRTSIPGVYAAGDVLCNHIKQVVIATGEGAKAGMAVEKELRGRKNIVVDWAK